jgi:hypothetical protein
VVLTFKKDLVSPSREYPYIETSGFRGRKISIVVSGYDTT